MSSPAAFCTVKIDGEIFAKILWDVVPLLHNSAYCDTNDNADRWRCDCTVKIYFHRESLSHALRSSEWARIGKQPEWVKITIENHKTERKIERCGAFIQIGIIARLICASLIWQSQGVWMIDLFLTNNSFVPGPERAAAIVSPGAALEL